jgi:energy-coupling factor transport system ATP-binding protein
MKLRFEDVSFTYPSGVRALDSIDLEIESGEIVAIIGENGAGKTTLVKMLNGLLRPSEGRVHVGDWNAAEHSTANLAARVGFLFQNPDEQLFERTVEREVAFGPRNLGLTERKVKSRVRAALKQVGLESAAKTHPYDLSQAERKLVALAATLAMDTPVLVLDEPSIGQDAAGRAAIGRILQDLHKMGRTLVMISHDVDFCAELAQRVLVMADGRIQADGSAQDVFAKSRVLKQAAVTPPQLLRLAQALRLSGAPLSVREFVSLYAARRSKAKRK